MPRVVIHWDENGWPNYMADGEVDLIFIDERVPRDRVYRYSGHRVDYRKIDELIGQSRIGTLGDMPGAEAAVLAHVNGEPDPRPKLKVVQPRRTGVADANGE